MAVEVPSVVNSSQQAVPEMNGMEVSMKDDVCAVVNGVADEHEAVIEPNALGEASEEDEATVAALLENDLLEIESQDCNNEPDNAIGVNADPAGIFEGASMGTLQNVAFGDMQGGENNGEEHVDDVLEDTELAEESEVVTCNAEATEDELLSNEELNGDSLTVQITSTFSEAPNADHSEASECAAEESEADISSNEETPRDSLASENSEINDKDTLTLQITNTFSEAPNPVPSTEESEEELSTPVSSSEKTPSAKTSQEADLTENPPNSPPGNHSSTETLQEPEQVTLSSSSSHSDEAYPGTDQADEMETELKEDSSHENSAIATNLLNEVKTETCEQSVSTTEAESPMNELLAAQKCEINSDSTNNESEVKKQNADDTVDAESMKEETELKKCEANTVDADCAKNETEVMTCDDDVTTMDSDAMNNGTEAKKSDADSGKDHDSTKECTEAKNADSGKNPDSMKDDKEVEVCEKAIVRKRSVEELEDAGASKKSRLDDGEKSEITSKSEKDPQERKGKSQKLDSVAEKCLIGSDEEDADDPDPVMSSEESDSLMIDEEVSAISNTKRSAENSAPVNHTDSLRPNVLPPAKRKRSDGSTAVDSDDENVDDTDSQSDSNSAIKRLKASALADSDTESGHSGSCPSPAIQPEVASQTADLIPALRKLRRGSLAQISKYDLEELITQKVCEAITERSPLVGELRRRCQALEEQNEKWQQIAITSKKQLRELDTVLQRYLSDVKAGKSTVPMKVTRSVGLQVAIGTRKPGVSPMKPRTVATPVPAKRIVRLPNAATPGPPPLYRQISPPKKVIAQAQISRPPQIRPKPSRDMMPPMPRPTVGPPGKAMRSPVKPLAKDAVIDLTDEPHAGASGKQFVPKPGHKLAFMVPSPRGEPQKFLIATPTSVVKASPSTKKVLYKAQPFVPKVQPVLQHPAPLPCTPMKQSNNPSWGIRPPRPSLKISNTEAGIVLSWNMSLSGEHSTIKSYQLFAYQEGTAPPHPNLWRQVGDVSALPLPMACTLSAFIQGHRYHFAVRALDVHGRIGTFSFPGSIVLEK